MATVPNIENADRLLDATATAAQTDFDVTWPVFAETEDAAKDDLIVMVNGAIIASVDFTFTGNTITGLSGCWDGGTVTLDDALAGAERVIIFSKRDPRRVGFFLEGQRLPFTELDKLTDDMVAQMRDMALGVNRALKIPIADYADGEDGELSVTKAQIEAAAIAAAGGALPSGTLGGLSTTAALLALFGASTTLANGTSFVTAGRTIAGDGGGSTFYYDSADTTTADNGGTVRVDGQGRRFKVMGPTMFNASLFGVGSGDYTIDTAAMKKAVLAARAVKGRLHVSARQMYINDTLDLSVSGADECVDVVGDGAHGTVINTTLTGTTPLFSRVGANDTYIWAGIKGITVRAASPGAVGSRNSGVFLLIQGTEFCRMEDIEVVAMTTGVLSDNLLNTPGPLGQYAEQTQFDRVFFDQCDRAIYFSTTAGSVSHRGPKGRIQVGVNTGQVGIYSDSGAYPYNIDLTIDGTGFGTSPKMLDLRGNVGPGNLRLLLEDQTGSGGIVCDQSSSRDYDLDTYLSVQAGSETVSGTLGLIPGMNYGKGRWVRVAPRFSLIAPDAHVTLPRVGGGDLMLVDATSGGVVKATLHASTGGVIYADATSRGTFSDPGSGGNKFWIRDTGGALEIYNRFGIDKTFDVLLDGTRA